MCIFVKEASTFEHKNIGHKSNKRDVFNERTVELSVMPNKFSYERNTGNRENGNFSG